MATTEIAIYGAGGYGREMAWLAEESRSGDRRYRVACFVDDDSDLWDKVVNSLPVFGPEAAKSGFPGLKLVVAAESPFEREKRVERARKLGFEFEPLFHPATRMSRWVEFGPGAVVFPNCAFTADVRFGAHVHVHLGCSIGHDVIAGDYTTFSQGVHVCGRAQFGKRVLVGAGAVFAKGEDKPLLIGHDAVIMPGAVVTSDVPAGLTVGSAPARPVSGRIAAKRRS